MVEEEGFLVNKREIVASGRVQTEPSHPCHKRRGGGERSEEKGASDQERS